MLIKFLKDYGDVKADEIRNTSTDEDAQLLIDQGVAVKYIATDEPDKTKEETEAEIKALRDSIVEEVTASLKTEFKLPAQAKEEKKNHSWNSFGDFAKSIINGKNDSKVQEYLKASGMNEAINSEGGFLIPEEFSTVLLTAMAKASVLAPKTLNFPVNNNLKLPYVNITSQKTSWTGGVRIYKPGEAIAKTGSKPELAKCELNLHKMTALVYVTDELLQDSPVVLETFLTTMVSTEFALVKDEDIVNGSGAGEALGIMNAPCLVTVSKETDQPAATITTDNVLKMFSRMYSPSQSKASWLIAADAIPQIGKLSMEVGTGGAPVFIADIKNPLGASLLGRPIEWSPHCQTLGTPGDIIFGDLSQYVTITKAGKAMETATSIHVKFVEDETAFRFVLRYDGQPWWSSAITPKHGTSTVSPFVALNERT